jgi:hypothetical protein
MWLTPVLSAWMANSGLDCRRSWGIGRRVFRFKHCQPGSCLTARSAQASCRNRHLARERETRGVSEVAQVGRDLIRRGARTSFSDRVMGGFSISPVGLCGQGQSPREV